MKLLTEKLRKEIPPLYSQEEVEDPMVVCKFFAPWSRWTWYCVESSAVVREGDGESYYPLAEARGEDVLFFGWVCGLEQELGYFTLSQLESVVGPVGLRIERDRYFEPAPLSEIRERHGVV